MSIEKPLSIAVRLSNADDMTANATISRHNAILDLDSAEHPTRFKEIETYFNMRLSGRIYEVLKNEEFKVDKTAESYAKEKDRILANFRRFAQKTGFGFKVASDNPICKLDSEGNRIAVSVKVTDVHRFTKEKKDRAKKFIPITGNLTDESLTVATPVHPTLDSITRNIKASLDHAECDTEIHSVIRELLLMVPVKTRRSFGADILASTSDNVTRNRRVTDTSMKIAASK